MKTTAIKIEGQIISSEIFGKIDSGDIKGQLPKDFGFEPNVKVKDEIQRAWANAKDQWRIFKRNIEKLKDDDLGTTETRKFWIIPFLEFLGYQLQVGRAETVNEKSYAISHRAVNIDEFPIHIVSYKDSLDRRREASGPRLSPHALVQEYINLTEHLYSLVTNGYQLRVLRDSGKLIRLTYLEFDLQKMMEEDLYAEFSIMYRLIHASRMPQNMTATEESLIEQYHLDSLEAGARIREKLSIAVEKSIQLLANGFLNNRNNEEIRKQIESQTLTAQQLYQYLLRFIYRTLFLMVIEERDIVYLENGKDAKYYKDIYYDNYSISRLRKLSEKIFFFNDKLNDLWIQLRNTFKIFGNENLADKLKLYPLNGELFDFGTLGILSQSDLDNHSLLSCVKYLSQFEDKETHSIIRVNYSALNVEEFGSVYEGLLEKAPSITTDGNKYFFNFVKGSERSSSGSHYTPEELVQPLIKHSLDYVIEDKLTLARKLANGEWRLVNGKLVVEGKNTDLVNEVNFNINEVINNEFISRFGSLEKSYGNSSDGLQINSSISERGDIRNDVSNPESGKFDSSKSSGRLGATRDEGISSIHPDSNRESERIGNSSSVNSQSGNIYSSSNRADSERMRNSEQTNAEFTEESFSQDEIINWWINLPKSNRQSLLSNHFLLSIKVCDVACGSGHILLSAARRIAQELTKVRTGEDQPSPEPFRAATRDVINNCIYGVDKNPLAVELCKVALWLEAHNPGMPLNFLDHKIKCGDSIVGLARIEELQNGIATEAFKTLPGDDKEIAAEFRKKNKEEIKNRDQYTLTDKVDIIEKLNNISVKFKSFNELPDNTVEAVRKKAEQFDVLKGTDWWQLKEAADLQAAQFFMPKTNENKNFLVTDKDYFRVLAGDKATHERQISTARAVSAEKRFFHWFLEFPEVMQEGGFDCILGNPPYLGGLRISTYFGDNYLHYIKVFFPSSETTTDLVAYFLLRDFNLLNDNKFIGLITTDTISQGDTRESCLDLIYEKGGRIISANRSVKWPGTANLNVSIFTLCNYMWKKYFYLEGKSVDFINPFFETEEIFFKPKSLINNLNKVFNGTYYLGDGFVIDSDIHKKFILTNSQNEDVILPLLIGNEVNDSPTQYSNNFIINFFNWSEAKAKNYKEPFKRVHELVKPLREKNKRKVYRDKWWIYGERRVNLYDNLDKLDSCFITSATTKYLNFISKPTSYIFAKSLYVFTSESWFEYSFVQSTYHDIWARRYSSTLGGTLSYTPSSAFDTFPFPQNLTKETEAELEKIGEEYHEFRKQLMLDLQLGLTKTYNLFHNPEVRSEQIANGEGRLEKIKELREFKNAKLQIPLEEAVKKIEKLRELHKQMDEAVLKAYGWGKIENSDWRMENGEMENGQMANRQTPIANNQSLITKEQSPIVLAHDFYEVDYLPENDRIRYTISPEARKEVLKRLLELNHKIHEEEVAAGLFDKKKSKGKGQKAKGKRDTETKDLFGG